MPSYAHFDQSLRKPNCLYCNKLVLNLNYPSLLHLACSPVPLTAASGPAPGCRWTPAPVSPPEVPLRRPKVPAFHHQHSSRRRSGCPSDPPPGREASCNHNISTIQRIDARTDEPTRLTFRRHCPCPSFSSGRNCTRCPWRSFKSLLFKLQLTIDVLQWIVDENPFSY